MYTGVDGYNGHDQYALEREEINNPEDGLSDEVFGDGCPLMMERLALQRRLRKLRTTRYQKRTSVIRRSVIFRMLLMSDRIVVLCWIGSGFGLEFMGPSHFFNKDCGGPCHHCKIQPERMTA